MSKADDDKIKALIHSIGLKYNLQDDVIRKIVNSPYKFTRETITNLEFSNIETEEQFDEMRVNFIYKYIGKLYTSFSRLSRVNKQSENLTNYNKEVKWKKDK